MTEDEARAWLDSRGWWQGEAGERLRAYAALLLDEADRQNLISAASRDQLWARHIVDSAQLLPMAKGAEGLWVDLGTGAGLPGIVIACLRQSPILMIEARPLRVTFLQRCIDVLGLAHAQVRGDKVERVQLDQPAAVISARAFAPMDRLLASAAHFTDSSTIWLLPKGRNAQNELEIAQRDWQASFHVEQSITDPESAIVTLTALSNKKASLVAPKRKKSGAQRRAMWKANHK
ncbi:MAG: 16S rRNA (guanine(527)-N(7))-methyltransferase RsmG [Sphingobium sp.]|nr:16S rRNA (guanine(527)-N(7))-methyltransferase RsmG [Sphingobium sp.]